MVFNGDGVRFDNFFQIVPKISHEMIWFQRKFIFNRMTSEYAKGLSFFHMLLVSAMGLAT